jgi:adenylate cyclase
MERRLAAILAADVVGYSRLMEADEVGVLRALKGHRDELIADHHGSIVKLMGDGTLVEFASVVKQVGLESQIGSISPIGHDFCYLVF